jgi:hypothetical protein
MRPATAVIVPLAVCLALSVCGCSKNSPSTPVENIPPETTLSYAPDQGDTVSYRVRMSWFGWDQDGVVTHYMTMWDSTGWVYTERTDSVFVVATGDFAVPRDEAYRHHTFAVKAVDNEGDEDPTPAGVAFTAENIFPETEFTSGPSDVTGPYVSFSWVGEDPEGDIAGYGYRLLYGTFGNYQEVESGELAAEQTTVEFGPLCGQHKLEVWSIDAQGARDETPAERTFYCSCGGPEQFVITSNVFPSSHGGGFWHIYPTAYDWPPVPIFAGEHITFDWSAEGQGIKFRHAFGDTSNWTAWSPADTHIEFEASPGEQEIHVAVRDTLGLGFHIHLLLDALETGLDDYILIVDDYTHQEYHPDWGSDAERDAFYDLLVSPFGERYQWDPAEHLSGIGARTPPDVETLAGASTVLWYCDPRNESSVIDDLFDLYRPYNQLAGYVRAGGNLVLCGWTVLSQIADASYPIDVTSGESEPGRDFIRDVLGIGYVDHSGYNTNPDSPTFGYCMHGAAPTSEAEALGFEPVYIDSGDCSGETGRWFFYCDPPDYAPSLLHCGIPVEKLESYQGEAIELYQTDSYLDGYFEGEPNAVLNLSGDNRGNVCYLGFPLYYMQTEQARALVERVLTLFGEEER